MKKLQPCLLAAAAAVFAPLSHLTAAEHIKHVFVIVLENESYSTTFGPNSPATYLSQTLTSKGVLLTNYYGTSHVSLGNYIAMISGQAADNETRTDCQVYADFIKTGLTVDGQVMGSGCVYPSSILTVADQLGNAAKTWKGYMEDMGNDPTRESNTCGHPALNTQDHTQTPEPPSASLPQGDQYAARHNPFVYFHSIIDSSICNTNVVRLEQLQTDLASAETTPNLVFITPNLCNDGHDAPCVTGQPGGLVSADAFLKKWIPIIEASPAYKSGLIVITFDEGGLTTSSTAGGGIVISAPGQTCCNQQPGPSLPPFPQSNALGPYTLSYQSFGGDQIGTVLLSPFLRPGSVSNNYYNHYSLLRTIEDIFDLGYIGYAAQPGLLGFFGCVSSDIVNTTKGQFSNCQQPQ
jgi:hypothetical protein